MNTTNHQFAQQFEKANDALMEASERRAAAIVEMEIADTVSKLFKAQDAAAKADKDSEKALSEIAAMINSDRMQIINGRLYVATLST